MRDTPHIVPRRFRLPAAFAVALFVTAIGYLGVTVAREVNAFDRSQSETAQWTLGQTETELLSLITALRDDDLELDRVRLRFDVLYSRIATLQQARVFAPLRGSEDFSRDLDALNAFLDKAVPILDSPDAVLLSRLSEVDELATEARVIARRLAIDGLTVFSEISERRRSAIAVRTAQLASAIVLLFAGLLLALVFLDRLNRRATARGRALQASSARINAIVETALDGIIVADADYRVVDFSPAAEDIFGLSAEDAIGQDFFRFVEEKPPAIDSGRRRAVIDGLLARDGHVTKVVSHADGSTFPAEIAFEQAEVPDGVIYIVLVRDISRRVEAQKEIVAARDTALANERMKSDFLATMSHEIRTPLNGLLGNMELMRDTPLSPAQNRYLDNMNASGRILMRHVNDVLDITQYDSGKMTVTPKATHISTLLDEIIATQESLAAVQRTSVTWDWDGPPKPWLSVDPDRLQHILLNLVGNAVKFTEDGSVKLYVACQPDADGWCLQIRISDTGPGISESMLPWIFEDFVTGDAAYNRQVGGTGLGLSIAKRFAEGLDGRLSVESTVGEGTTFTLDVPVALANPPKEARTLPSLPPIPSLSILMVEDNPMNRTVIREMLESEGHRVREACDGCQGVTMARETPFDVIMMDISMPVLDGYAAALEIKKDGGASCCVPIVALTANALATDRAKFRDAGMVATLTKPLTRVALREVLRELSSEPPVISGQLLDRNHLAETIATVGPEAFSKLKRRMADEMETFLAWVDQSPPASLSDLAKRAHKVAGSAAMFGAVRMQLALNALEDVARKDDPISTNKMIPYINRIWEETEEALATLPTDPSQAAE